MRNVTRKTIAALGLTMMLSGMGAGVAGAQESARPGHPWAGPWEDAKPITPQDDGFWDLSLDQDRIISPKGNANVQCYSERWATGGCRQDGRELPILTRVGWRAIFVNDPALETILLPLSPAIDMLVNSSSSSS